MLVLVNNNLLVEDYNRMRGLDSVFHECFHCNLVEANYNLAYRNWDTLKKVLIQQQHFLELIFSGHLMPDPLSVFLDEILTNF